MGPPTLVVRPIKDRVEALDHFTAAFEGRVPNR